MVVGLGNPGRKYARTRHNAGFLVVERLAERWGIDPGRKTQSGALVGDGRVRDVAVVLVRPQSYMNLSGQPTRALMDFYKLTPEDVLVVHDEVDLPFGAVRLKSGGGHGGHNGLRDLSRHLGPNYGRVRVGVSRPPEGWETADYVLGGWTEAEAARLPEIVETACDAVEAALSQGLPAAMNQFNTRAKDPASTQSATDAGDSSATGGVPPRGSVPPSRPSGGPAST